MRQEQHSPQLAATIIEFCRFLRSHGFTADMRQTITALEAARIIGAAGLHNLRFALQAALCTNGEEWERWNDFAGLSGGCAEAD